MFYCIFFRSVDALLASAASTAKQLDATFQSFTSAAATKDNVRKIKENFKCSVCRDVLHEPAMFTCCHSLVACWSCACTSLGLPHFVGKRILVPRDTNSMETYAIDDDAPDAPVPCCPNCRGENFEVLKVLGLHGLSSSLESLLD